MTDTADVVIVGGGVIGLAAALQLLRGGVRDVTVVERDVATGRGSSARANGGVRAQFATAINVRFSQVTIASLAELDAAHGGRCGLRRAGYLFMTGTETGEARLRAQVEMQRSAGLAVDWLQPDDVLRIAPFVRAEGLRGGTFCAEDGLIDPHGVCAVLDDEVRARRGRVLLEHPVTALERVGGGATVACGSRTISTGAVVNAAGPQAREVAALAGVDLPVRPYRRNLACTERVDGLPALIPMCVDADTGLLIRREGEGMLIAYSDPADTPSSDTSFDPAFLHRVAELAAHRFPFLRELHIDSRKCWAGSYPETPDHQAVIDTPAAAPWFVQCAGFGGHGIMHSLAAGQAVTELVRDGACTSFDLSPFRLDRFRDGALTAETAVL